MKSALRRTPNRRKLLRLGLTNDRRVITCVDRTFTLDGETVIRDQSPIVERPAAGKAAYRKVHICYINGRKVTWKLARLKLYLATGELPEVVDHIDGNTRNDNLINLRAATAQLNAWNSRAPRKKSKLPRNVEKVGNRFGAYITISRKKQHLGVYESAEEASAVAKAESERLRGHFHRYRRKGPRASSNRRRR